MSGHKRLLAPASEINFRAGQVFAIPRLTQWDMVNEAKPGGRYEARLIGFAPPLIEKFYERFSQFAVIPTVQGCGRSVADDMFAATFTRAFSALIDNKISQTMSEHRALEVLLLLAERGIVFSAPKELSWADRVRRLIGQRPQANWTLDTVAGAFHQSASTLQRRLAAESTTFTQCLRDVRLETAMALLQDKGLQVSDVAACCGYDSHSRFSAAFRKRFGFTPSHLRP